MTFTVRLTPLAQGFVSRKSSAAALIERTRAEIDELLQDRDTAPLDLIFHTFEFADTEFICYPRDGAIEVDTCSRKETDKFDRGPLAGQSVKMPVPDSER
jgi:hypothetical protein